MSYKEKLTWNGRELILERRTSPVEVISAQSEQVKLEKINIKDPSLHPGNYDEAEGVPLPIFKAEGIRIDLSKRTKKAMTFFHRNMDCDELIFCFKGGIHWETELGNITLKPGEMFVIPRGIAHRSLPPANSKENIIIELKINGTVSKLI